MTPSATDVPLLERDRELAAITGLFGAVRDRAGESVVMTGPAGIGKTRLIEALAERAAAAGFAVHRARAGELEGDLAWGVVRQLFVALIRRAASRGHAALFGGAAGLALPVLGLGDSPALSSDALSPALHGLYWLTANLAEEQPLLLAVDDAHWADPASSRFLLYLAQRLDDIPILLAVTIRSGEPSGGDLLRALRAASQRAMVELGPLSIHATEVILARMTGQNPEPEFIRACHDATRGNPYLLNELGLQLAREGVRPVAAEVGRLPGLHPESVSHSVSARLGRLDPDALRLAQAVAVCGAPVAPGRAARLADLADDRTALLADRLAEASVLSSGAPLDFVHPLVRSAVYEGMAPIARDRAHRRAAQIAAESGDDPHVAATQLLHTCPGRDPWVAETLHAAAEFAHLRGAPREAITWLHRALAEPPARDLRPSVLLRLGTLELESSDPIAVVHLRDAHASAGDARVRGAAAMALASALLYSGHPLEAVDACEQAVQELAGRDRELDLRLEMIRIAAGWNCPPGRPVVPRWTADQLGGSTVGERMLLTVLASDVVFAPGGSASQAVKLIRRGLGDGRRMAELAPDSFGLWGAIFLLHRTDALDISEPIERAVFDEARRRGNLMGLQMAALHRAARWLRRGSLPQVEADIADALEVPGHRSPYFEAVLLYLRLETMLEQGRLREAELQAARLPALQATSTPVATLFATSSRGRMHVRQGRHQAALDDLFRVANETRIDNPAVFAWRSDAAPALAALGRRDEARKMVQHELRLARDFGIPRPIGVALRAAGALACGDERIDLLRESVSTLERCPSHLERAHALAELGSALRRSGRRRDAVPPLRTALELAGHCGATALVKRTRRELADAGARPHRPAQYGRDALTPSELRIAQLAGEGMSNKEIAQTLFVSLRTVETHLTHAYSKLGISARRELERALATRVTDQPHANGSGP